MSKTRENRLWGWLKKGGASFKQRLHMGRVENAVGEGMADVNGCLQPGPDFWIELKTEARPVRTDTKIRPKFQPGQAPWHRRRRVAGGRAFVLLQVGSGNGARRYLLPGELVPSMARGMTEKRLEELSLITPVASAEEVIQTAATVDLGRGV